MTDFIGPIAGVRDSVGAILRIHPLPQGKTAQKKGKPPQFNCGFVGTASCVVQNRVLLTAYHVFNEGKPRLAQDLFYLFAAPGNGSVVYHAQVANFIYEDPGLDITILEIAGPAQGTGLPAVPVTFAPKPDGTRVLTYGFPAPQIVGANLDANGAWLGGQLFLMGHANEGIVAASYRFNGAAAYELNVGWHHGESGGPIFGVDPVAAFAMMQFYRNIQSPHGVVAGPHVGRALSNVRTQLQNAGATIV